jgi:hypothetical protein
MQPSRRDFIYPSILGYAADFEQGQSDGDTNVEGQRWPLIARKAAAEVMVNPESSMLSYGPNSACIVGGATFIMSQIWAAKSNGCSGMEGRQRADRRPRLTPAGQGSLAIRPAGSSVIPAFSTLHDPHRYSIPACRTSRPTEWPERY